jgi:hypothetical protein
MRLAVCEKQFQITSSIRIMALQTFTNFYRSCLFQMIIVGLVGFCEPGIWSALNNLGAGGQASVSRSLRPRDSRSTLTCRIALSE